MPVNMKEIVANTIFQVLALSVALVLITYADNYVTAKRYEHRKEKQEHLELEKQRRNMEQQKPGNGIKKEDIPNPGGKEDFAGQA